MTVAAPIQSMTGSGVGAGASELGPTTVEVRSTNGRTLAVKPRLPNECQGLEAALERRVRERLRRGTVVVVVETAGAAAGGPAIVDTALAERAAAELRALAQRLGLAADLRLEMLLGVPGVVAADRTRPRASWEPPPLLQGLIDEALDQLVASREQEGAAMVAVVGEQLAEITRRHGEIAARAASVAQDHRQRLLRRVNEFLAGQARVLSDQDVLREVALFADRVDVNEELQRIAAHLTKVHDLLAAGGEVGRSLDFLLQELLREVNTVGSKSPDVTIAHAVVAAKMAIDRLKEIAANLE